MAWLMYVILEMVMCVCVYYELQY